MKNFSPKLWFFVVVSAFFLIGCATQKDPKQPPVKKEIVKKEIKPQEPKPKKVPQVVLPEVKREFRAAWIATVANINWPSKNNLSVAQQKTEALEILDRLKEANFNAVVFQARPSADAFYQSDLEPWSYFLTGEIGKAPSPYYDPLEFWIEESHKRGMELHVWLNPYRAHHTTGGKLNSKSIASTMNKVTYRLRNGMYWMDPSDPTVQDHTAKVIRDLVERYDLDAVHIDDYFYPYREYNGGRDFPDQKLYASYLESGGSLSKPDWRRANVNKFIKRIYHEIKEEKAWVKFGISPFGIWKPGYPAGISGTSQYDELYADAKLWLNQGWVDYFSPQLYWKEEGPQRFSALLSWWEAENTQNRHLWPGLNTIGIKGVDDKPTEIRGQMSTIRQIMGKDAGEIHYSVDGLLKNGEMYSVIQSAYRQPALVPVSPWIPSDKLSRPLIESTLNGGVSVKLSWNTNPGESVSQWVLYTQYGKDWEYEILEMDTKVKVLDLNRSGEKLHAVALKSVDRLGNLSPYVLQMY
ncbi:glycoside hydrolase family 10 protein [Chryseobacterium sp. A321]